MVPPLAFASDLIARYWQKLLKYAGVSVVGIVLGQILLQLFYSGFGWSAAVSNLCAVVIATLPVYWLNRTWVWGRSGPNRIMTEVLPFWGMALVGLALSTLAVHYAEGHWEHPLAISAANLSGFLIPWIAKFFLLDAVMFGDKAGEDSAAVTADRPVAKRS
ncbi:MAG: GtrA family protein [Acidimicrobiales bacterium]|nr:GtrA family protein [Acidimicrobiales bacterium]